MSICFQKKESKDDMGWFFDRRRFMCLPYRCAYMISSQVLSIIGLLFSASPIVSDDNIKAQVFVKAFMFLAFCAFFWNQLIWWIRMTATNILVLAALSTITSTISMAFGILYISFSGCIGAAFWFASAGCAIAFVTSGRHTKLEDKHKDNETTSICCNSQNGNHPGIDQSTEPPSPPLPPVILVEATVVPHQNVRREIDVEAPEEEIGFEQPQRSNTNPLSEVKLTETAEAADLGDHDMVAHCNQILSNASNLRPYIEPNTTINRIEPNTTTKLAPYVEP